MDHRHAAIEGYLGELSGELRWLGARRERVLEEARAHLEDAVLAGRRAGLSAEQAEGRALAAFGAARAVAAPHLADHGRTRLWRLLPPAVGLGLVLAFVDSRPTWDDTGISALAVFLVAGIFGVLEPRRPWLWALAVGAWIPLFGLVLGGNAAALLALAVALVAAYAGGLSRRLLTPA